MEAKENSGVTSLDFIDKALDKALDEQTAADLAQGWLAYRLDLTQRISDPQCAISIKGVPCIPLGELIGVSGRAKVGKSQFLYFLLGMIAGGRAGDTVQPVTPNMRVLVCDTEQSKASFARCLRRALRFGGLPEYGNYDSIIPLYLRKCKGDKQEIIAQAIQDVKPNIVIIDGIRDLLDNFNDIEQSQAVMEWLLQVTADNEQCAVICVLHQNKSKDDSNMRGHLGSELLHKLYDCFEVSKVDGCFTVKSTASRGRDIPAFSFRINDDGDFEEVEVQVKAKEPKKDPNEAIRISMCKCFEGGQALGYADLTRKYVEVSGLAEATAKRHIRIAVDKGYIKGDKDSYSLIPNV